MADAPATTDATTEPAEPTPDPAPAATADPELGDAGKKALEAEREARKTAEKRARDASKELETLRRESMSETEKAIDEARSIARAETLREVGGRLVDAEVRAAMAGRNVNVDALLEGLDRTAFLDDTGDVNRDALAAWAERIAPMTETKDEPKGDPFLDLGQGTRTGDALKGDPLADLITSRLGL